jgi:diguanylate cyclase (GGDEF)-like protein
VTKKDLFLISRDEAVAAIADRTLGSSYKTAFFNSLQDALDQVYSLMPSLIIVDMDPSDTSVLPILRTLKKDPVFSHLPVLAIVNDIPDVSSWNDLPVEDYVKRCDVERELALRAILTVSRVERTVETNPLTRLPGNIEVSTQIQWRLGEEVPFALAYADLDNFKPFNDRYGFSRGDDVIKMTGRLIRNLVKSGEPEKSFVGHIGGDDFIFITDVEVVETISRQIVVSFDEIVPMFYDEADRDKGLITSTDRQGNIREFPFVSVSIGIADTQCRKYLHHGEMVQVASEMKSFAKKFAGSCFTRDRRAPDESLSNAAEIP